MKKITAIILSFILLLSAAPYVYADDTDVELIAHWNFDSISDSNTIEDLTGNGNDLLIQDPSYNVVDGYRGNALDFNGGTSAYDNSKHMAISSDIIASQINGSPAVTITCAVKKEVKGSGTNFTMFAFNAGSNSIMMYAQASKVATNARSDYNSAAVATSGEVIWPNIDDSTSPDGWMQFALVMDYANNNVKFYADGVLIAEEQAEATPQRFATAYANYKTDVNDITKGYFGVGGRHVLIDDLKFYKGALDEDTIKKSVAPVLDYSFEDAEGGETADNGIYGMNMSVSGAEVVEGAEGNALVHIDNALLPVCTHRGLLYGAYQQSISCWLRLADGRLPGVNQVIYADGEYNSLKIELTDTGAIAFSGKSSNGDSLRTVTTENYIFSEGDTSWHHVYADFDYRAKTGRIYVNGGLVAEAPLAFANHYYNMSGLGSKNDYMDLSSGATVIADSLKIYRRCLLDSEITALAQAVPMVKAVISSEDSTVSADCTVTNLTASDIAENGMTLILCAYEKDTNKMVAGAMKNMPAIGKYKGIEGQIFSVDVPGEPTDYVYKLFAWYGIDGIASYQDEIVYTFE